VTISAEVRAYANRKYPGMITQTVEGALGFEIGNICRDPRNAHIVLDDIVDAFMQKLVMSQPPPPRTDRHAACLHYHLTLGEDRELSEFVCKDVLP
jgi:hypothetical protein